MDTETPIPQTQYAESDGLSIAYQVFGRGSTDLVFVPGLVTHIELNWDMPGYAPMMRRLGEHFRVILFDKRGQGLSDRFEGVPTLEERMDDVRDVMRAAGSTRAVLVAYSEGGAMGALFAATHPERVERLILLSAMARFSWAPDYPHSPTIEQIQQHTAATWGKPESVRLFAPSRVDDAAFAEAFTRWQRQSTSPSAVRRLQLANDQIDVRAILPQVHRPTLIIHRRRDRAVSVANGRYLADHLPEAEYLELPGKDHMPYVGDAERIVEAIVRFGTAKAAMPARDSAERWLATVLFTDIVGSTELAVRLGDAAWRDLQQQFHAVGRKRAACASRARDRHRRRRPVRCLRRPGARGALRGGDSEWCQGPRIGTARRPAHRRGGKRRCQAQRHGGAHRRAHLRPGRRRRGSGFQHVEGPGRWIGPAFRGARQQALEGRAWRVAAVPCAG